MDIRPSISKLPPLLLWFSNSKKRTLTLRTTYTRSVIHSRRLACTSAGYVVLMLLLRFNPPLKTSTHPWAPSKASSRTATSRTRGEGGQRPSRFAVGGTQTLRNSPESSGGTGPIGTGSVLAPSSRARPPPSIMPPRVSFPVDQEERGGGTGRGGRTHY